MGRFVSLEKVCSHCNSPYLAGDKKSKFCSLCRQKVELKCSCGCGESIIKPKHYENRQNWLFGHRFKGKTYSEIYGGALPKCGAQRGTANSAKRPEVRIKISEGVKNSYTPELRETRRSAFKLQVRTCSFTRKRYTNSIGEWMRSSLEVLFSEYLISRSIPYEYEKEIILYTGHSKFIDFTVFDSVLVEISGYAHDEWRRGFNQSMQELRDTVNNPILLLSYPEFAKHNSELTITSLPDLCHRNIDMFCEAVSDETRVLEALKFCKSIVDIRKRVSENEDDIHRNSRYSS